MMWCLFRHITRVECNPLVIYSGQISAAHDGVLEICEVTLVEVQQETQHRDKEIIAQPQPHFFPPIEFNPGHNPSLHVLSVL